MTVALLGGTEDAQVRAVGRALDDRAVDWTVWDAEQWPGSTPLSHSVGAEPRVSLDGPVDLESIRAVYFRRVGFDPRGPEFDGDLEERPYSLINQLREYRGLVMSVLNDVARRGVPVVNPPEAMSVHGLKPYQCATFDDAGLPVPETLTTNDPARVESFVERVGEAIYKPVAGGGHARAVTPSTLSAERLERLENAPVQFQERLSGTNYRLFVVDGEVVATGRIESDELDYRLGEHEVEAATVPDRVEHAAVRAAETLGLPFSGVDVVFDGDEFGLLEANPSPMFAAFDERAGTGVADRLAEYLATR